MNDWQQKVREFHEAMGVAVAESPREIHRDRKELRDSLIVEETRELYAAMFAGGKPTWHADLTEVADALVDIVYVTLGAALEFGIDLDPIFDAVHEANMRKLGGPVRPDGKILKPEGWQPADIAALIEEQKS